jgi:hypothetical protein
MILLSDETGHGDMVFVPGMMRTLAVVVLITNSPSGKQTASSP